MKTKLIIAFVLLVGFFLILPEPAPAPDTLSKAETRSVETTTAIQAGIISDFNQSDLKTTFGAGLSASSDHFAGGKSVAAISLISDGDNHYLEVKGEIKKGFPYPWSGLAFIPGSSYTEAANMSELSVLVFDAKTETNLDQLSIMVFQQDSFQPSTQTIKLSADWKTYRVELAKFKNIDLAKVSNISFVRTSGTHEFVFMFDNFRVE